MAQSQKKQRVVMDISIIVPVYNEKATLRRFCEELISVLNQTRLNYEILLIDDGSNDCSWDIIRSEAIIFPFVRGIRFSRNFGQQIALSAGLDSARGKAVICMDADLQHPPSIIPKMIDAWQNGAMVVNTIREDSKLPLVKRLGTRMFYHLFSKCCDVQLNHFSPDFRLLDRIVVEKFRDFRERDRFVRGLIGWLGFPSCTIRFKVPEHTLRKSSYTFKKMVMLALDGLTSFTALPLRLAFFFGLGVSVISAIYAVYALYANLFLENVVKGWTSLLIVVLFLGGCQMVFLGIIGEYLLRIYNEVKGRPLYVVSDSINEPGRFHELSGREMVHTDKHG